MKFSSFHMMSISTSCSSHVSFERSSHANSNSFANKQMKCELCEMLNIKRCYGNKFESLNAYCVRLYALFLRTLAYLRLGSFESGCMHNPLKSIPAPRCLKSWTCQTSHLACVSFEYAENCRRLKASHSITQTSYQTTTFRNRHYFVTCSDVIPLQWRSGQLDTNACRWCQDALQHSTPLK